MKTSMIIKGKYTLALILLCSATVVSIAQQHWQMQPIDIATRWAKDVQPDNALPEYPRPQLVRSKWTNLNGLWEYAITDTNGVFPSTYHGKILVPYPVESALSGVKKNLQPDQLLWYKRTITKPPMQAGERLLLHFGAVDFDASVYLNGSIIGRHTGGYQNFTIEITGKIKSGKNDLVVKVWDPSDKGYNLRGKQVLTPAGIMYTASSGIWQTVWLETVPAAFIESLKLTADIDKGMLRLQVKTNSAYADYSVEARAFAEGIAAGNVTIPADNKTHFLPVKATAERLWSPDDPFLYDLVVRIKKKGKVIDEVRSYFGMRKVEIKKDEKGIERIFLNNKYIYNLGTLDQGFWPDGLYTAPTDAALKFDIQAAKAMGFNTIRKHIKIEPARWYYYCDKLGMMVWQDMVNPANDTKQSRQQFEKENAENLQQLHNYPSVTTWVLFNEGWGAYDQARLTRWVKGTDPSRLVNGHSGENYFNASPSDPDQKWPNSDMTDIHAYPAPAVPDYLPGKARVLGEFGGIGVSIENHLWDDVKSGWGYGGKISPGTMRTHFSAIVDSLITYEKKGLSASIYTQPFDVESEQNGLMTYDRAVIKIPLREIRKIHASLWPATSNYKTATKDFTAVLADTGLVTYAVKLHQYKSGKKEPFFLRNLAITAMAEKDKENARSIAEEYIQQMQNPFTERNLKFIKHFTLDTKSAAFTILYNNIEKVNRILGKDEAETAIFRAIENDEIKPKTGKAQTPDWNTLEKDMIEKYGDLGREIVWQNKLFYSISHQDWKVFSETIQPWFVQYGHKRKWVDGGLSNNFGWAAFTNITDTTTLETVSKITAHGLQIKTSGNLLDTHANLLYKLGKIKEALQWQSKAVEFAPYDQEIKNTFEKMKKGEPTWSVQGKVTN